MSSNWFCVKTLYRAYADGRPEKPDLIYDPDATLVEERNLLFKAKNKREAIMKAEREAKDYAEQSQYINPYGQNVRTRYLGYHDIWEIDGGLADKQEIFCMSRVMSKKVSDSKVAFMCIEKRVEKVVKTKRKKFINRDYVQGYE